LAPAATIPGGGAGGAVLVNVATVATGNLGIFK
jgi:hypothetical protein